MEPSQPARVPRFFRHIHAVVESLYGENFTVSHLNRTHGKMVTGRTPYNILKQAIRPPDAEIQHLTGFDFFPAVKHRTQDSLFLKKKIVKLNKKNLKFIQLGRRQLVILIRS